MMIPNSTPSFRILEGIRWTEVVKSCFWRETSKFVWWRSTDGGRTIYPGIRLWDVQLRSTPHWNHRRLLRTGSMYKPQTSPNIPKPPKLRAYMTLLWKLMTGVATEQRDPNKTTRYDTAPAALLSLWGALVVVDRCRRCDRGLWSRCAEAAATGDWQPRAGRNPDHHSCHS